MTLAIIAILLLCTWICPGKIADQLSTELKERRKEKTSERITENLKRVKSMSRPATDTTSLVENLGLTISPMTFSEHKQILNVDTEDSLAQLMSVLSLSEPRWVGVDLEHSKRHSYHGLICMI
mmetsp:Transcript_28988/g.38638  ORF Transcript_28988/g.38638 Transcript_28988/m.38638 type:complete len:123 (+) Transcript_28988:115-483(+)